MRLSFWPTVGLSIFAAAGAAVLLTLQSFHQFARPTVAFAGTCKPVAGIAGPEDLEIDPVARRAYISSFDRRAAANSELRGGIFALSIDDPLAAEGWQDRTLGAPAKFEPLGLSLYLSNGERRLFVVNAAAKSIELFEIAKDGSLNHLETFGERRLTSPNDVVAIGPRSFYVSNDVDGDRNSLFGRLQFLSKAKTGKVFLFDGAAWKIAAENLRFANGINKSLDGRRVYVAETAGAALKIYNRNPNTNALYLTSTVPMGAAVDNINVDNVGALWIGAHPKPLLLPRHLHNPEKKAPSVVIRYDDLAGLESWPTPIYADDGGEISASTVAAKLGSTLLIGALVERKFLICNLPE